MDSDDDDAPRPAKRKKKGKAAEAPPQKIGAGGLPPRTFAPAELTRINRVLWQAEDDGEADEAAVAAARRRLGLRVPDVRRQPCKFFLRGACSRGAACNFKHACAICGATDHTARTHP